MKRHLLVTPDLDPANVMRTELPEDTVSARELRRRRVSRLTCKLGRVCSGLLPCECDRRETERRRDLDL